MKVFICVVLLAAIAAAIPVKKASTEDLNADYHNKSEEISADDSEELLSESTENAIPDELSAPEPSQIVEDINTQSENSNRDKRFIFFYSWPAVYAAPVVYETPVIYETPVVKTVICFILFSVNNQSEI